MDQLAPTSRAIAEPVAMLPHARAMATQSVRALLAWQLLRTVLRLLFAALLAATAGQMIEIGVFSSWTIGAAIAVLGVSAAAGWLGDRRLAIAETMVAEAVRDKAQQCLETMPARAVQALPAGALIAGLQRHPDSIAALVVSHRIAALMLGIGPLLVTAAIIAVSWQAALALMLATPIMVMFFIVVGGTIHARATTQEKAFGQLAAQFEDRIRTLPTILAAHGLQREADKLVARMTDYATSTMGVLKVAFLNAGIIDFFASLSIAVLAVFLGLGHLKLIAIPGFSGLQLWQSLFILMLAPEFFAPFRRYAEQYHAKAEGDAAAAAMDDVLKRRDTPDLAGWDPSAVDLPSTGLVAIIGQSGSGKSTLLRRLAGVEPLARPAQGSQVDDTEGVDWTSTDVHVPGGTLGAALAWNRPSPCRTKLMLAASRVGLLDDGLLPGGLDARIEPGGQNLSGGQRLRLGLARAVLSDRSIYADEPTAKLDAGNAALVRVALADCARQRLVVVATHDAELTASARIVVDLDNERISRREAAA